MSITHNYLDYLNLNENLEFVNEGAILDFLKDKLSIFKKIRIINKAIERKDIKTIESSLDTIPVLDLKDVKLMARKLSKSPNDFDKSYMLSKRVLRNSIPQLQKAPPELLESFATTIALISTVENYEQKTVTREAGEYYDENDYDNSDQKIEERTRSNLSRIIPVFMRNLHHLLKGTFWIMLTCGIIWFRKALIPTRWGLTILGVTFLLAKIAENITSHERDISDEYVSPMYKRDLVNQIVSSGSYY